jgi:hypothetical protein
MARCTTVVGFAEEPTPVTAVGFAAAESAPIARLGAQ